MSAHGDHPMHPLVDADGHITEKGAAFIQRAGEIMDEAAELVPNPFAEEGS